MSKTISQLTVSDFPYIYKLNDSIRLVSNVSGLGASYYHSSRTGGHIYLNSGIPTNYNEYFTGYSYDWDADNNDSPLKFPTSFMDYTGKIPRNDVDTNVLNVGSAWFSSPGQKMVWLYFVVPDTPKDLEHINPSLKADNVTVSITGNTITLTANSGYKIKDATLDIGNSLFGDSTPLKFTVSPDQTTATVTVTDQSLIDPSQEYNLTVHTKQITDLEHINPSLRADNVSVSITGNTVNLTANSGYKITSATLDIGNSLFGDDTPLKFNIASDGLSASVTVTDDNLIDPNQQYDLSVRTEQISTPTEPTKPTEPTTPSEPTPDTPQQKLVNYSTTGYSIHIPNDCSSNDGTGENNSDGFRVIPPSNLTLTTDTASTIRADVNGDKTNTSTPTLKDNILVFNNFTSSQWSALTTSFIRDNNGNLIYNLQDYVKQLKPKYTGTVTSKVANVTATLNSNTGEIKIVIPQNTNFTGIVNVLDNTGNKVDTLAITNLTVTVPDTYANNNFEVIGSLQYETKYTVNINQIKDYVTYSTNGLVITLTAKDKILINSLHATAELTVLGESYTLDDSTISIAADKKSAAISVPTNYNGSGYEITITGDFSNQTPTPTNPTGTNSIHIYQLDDDTLTKFSTDAIQYYQGGNNQTGYDFQKFITQLYKLPFAIPNTESEGTTNILTGWYTINRPARKIKNTHYILNLGTIKVVNVNNNGFDHNVASCTLYLPYVSPIKIPYETILNHNLNAKYDTDLLAGKTTVNIFVDDKLLTSLQTNINENLDLYNIYNDSINGTLSSILNNTLDHCYIKVEYYKPIENLVSYETNEHGTLKDYKGYLQTKNTIVSCGTNEEQQAITQLLEQGVIIK